MKSRPSPCLLKNKTVTTLCILTLLAVRAFPYGDAGHKTVGAMADKLIAGSPNTVAHVRALLGTETLEQAAIWADTVKIHFDPADPEMVAFTKANVHFPDNSGPHDHHAYHYTDIPIQETHYFAGSHGAQKIDVVHMIRNCIAILEGHSSKTNNPTNIPPKIALRLLAHFVGDVHQPLHVGAAYFASATSAVIVNPNTTAGTAEDHGGNKVSFHSTNLHSYWDTTAVLKAMDTAHAGTPEAFADFLIAHPAPGAASGSFMSGWAVKWANEVMPIATEAHNRLTFRTAPHGWNAKAADLPAYDAWATQQVTTELNHAGFRLAEVLKKIWP